ncbi:MAG TPA: MFS transporter [Terracidiphilus sp.]|nr:MFS transporter [Terracidiphilus sp.]
MPPPVQEEAEAPSQATPKERPWLFNFLIAPGAVIAIGLVNGALSYLFRREGVDPGRAASIVALLGLPHTIYFLWGPLTDFWMRRRTWLMLAAAAAGITLAVAFHQARLSSTSGVALLFLGACFGEFAIAACGGMMGTLRSEVNRRRACSFYQAGSLAFGAIAVFVLVSMAARFNLDSLGWFVAAMVALPGLFALAAPAQSVVGERTARETASRIWAEFKSTFLRWEAIPYTLLVTSPCCSGAMIGLLPALAADYGVSGRQVAWINGLAGALLTAGGALAASLIPVRIRAPIAFLLAGLVNACTLLVLSLGPQKPAIYFAGTVLFLFSIGVGYALFTGVVLEFLGGSGKSGSARYAIINSLGNLPVAYMAYLNGRGYAHWGPRAMPGTDAVLSFGGITLLLAYFVFHRRRPQAA